MPATQRVKYVAKRWWLAGCRIDEQTIGSEKLAYERSSDFAMPEGLEMPIAGKDNSCAVDKR